MMVAQPYLVDQDWEKLDKALADRQSGFRRDMKHLKKNRIMDFTTHVG